jgi:hypothetical protein
MTRRVHTNAIAEMAAHPSVPDPEQLYPGRSIPEILAVTPDTLALTGRAFDALTLHVTYRIVHPEKVDRAVLQLWNDAAGVIDTALLPVQEHWAYDWTVQGPINVGPLVRLRAHCPRLANRRTLRSRLPAPIRSM